MVYYRKKHNTNINFNFSFLKNKSSFKDLYYIEDLFMKLCFRNKDLFEYDASSFNVLTIKNVLILKIKSSMFFKVKEISNYNLSLDNEKNKC